MLGKIICTLRPRRRREPAKDFFRLDERSRLIGAGVRGQPLSVLEQSDREPKRGRYPAVYSGGCGESGLGGLAVAAVRRTAGREAGADPAEHAGQVSTRHACDERGVESIAAPSGDPHSPQYASSGSFAAPQAGHANANATPQPAHNFRPPRFRRPHALQVGPISAAAPIARRIGSWPRHAKNLEASRR